MNLNNSSIKIDFLDKAYQRPFSHAGAELLACALGWKQGLRKVLDTTAGLGKDAVFLARMGFEVWGLEKNPLLFSLLQKALLLILDANKKEGKDSKIKTSWAKRLHFLHKDSLEFLSSPLSLPFPIDSIYIDPMFFLKHNKSALPKKDMQCLRSLLEEKGEEKEKEKESTYSLYSLEALDLNKKLLQAALKVGASRVVVKRSSQQKPWEKPLHTYKGKSVCYDLFA